MFDTEHCLPEGLDACLALCRALDLPGLVRVPAGAPAAIQHALDAGAVGVVVPHVQDAAEAASLARRCRFGAGGRGFAGSTRWAGVAAGTPMAELVARARRETLCVCMIEEAEAVEAAAAIAATDGVDALFVGPADLAISLGVESMADAAVQVAIARVAEAARGAGKAMLGFCPAAEGVPALFAGGVSVVLVGSAQGMILAGARAVAAATSDAAQSASATS